MPLPAALLLAGLVLLSGTEPSRQAAAELRARGLELGFNLDHAEALTAFRESIAADPENLAGYRLLAAALWSDALFQQGAITADDFMGEAGSPFRPRQSNPDLENAANELLRRAEALAAVRRGSGAPPDSDAAYQVGAAYRFLSTLAATIGGSQWRSLGAARRAYQEHQRVLTIDPRQTDAGLTVGLYRFWVSTMPAWSRLVARVAGLDGDGALGVRLVEEASAAEGPFQANALFSLIVIHNNLERYDDALSVIGRLQRRFPRNRLLWLEAGRTELRAGRAADARTSLERGLRMLETDSRPRAFGELARWRYHYGVAFARLHQIEAASQQFRAALQGDGLEWVRGRTHLELGKLASGSGEAARAKNDFQTALRICEAADDVTCINEAKTLLTRK